MATVGILFPGDMGTALAALLLQAGNSVVTVLEGRSRDTEERCASAGIEALGSLGDVVIRSDLVISSVPPGAAVDVARQVADAVRRHHAGPLFLDANSISPVTMREIATAFAGTAAPVIDASIHGQAAHLETRATIYLSGGQAPAVARIVGGHPPRIVILGPDVGQASLFKMLMGGTSKGVVALLLELSDLAQREGVLESFLAECNAWYPEISGHLERVLPSYPRHIYRRIDEMHELAMTVSNVGMEPTMSTASRDLFARMAASPCELQGLVRSVMASREAPGSS